MRPFGKGLDLKCLKEAPHGLDLGPLEPCLPERLFTRDGRLHLAPELLVADLGRLRSRLAEHRAEAERKDRPMVLIGRRQVRSDRRAPSGLLAGAILRALLPYGGALAGWPGHRGRRPSRPTLAR